jgi:hypothetical protein
MQKIESRSSVASKKLYERSEFRVFALAFAFSQSHNRMIQKLPHESSESEIQ